MSPGRPTDPPSDETTASGPPDSFLVSSVLAGDAAALSMLIERYDRLVRYTIFHASRDRCLKDPQWLDSVASATWSGFVRSMSRSADPPPRSLRPYLVQIARNQVVSALRASVRQTVSLDACDESNAEQLEADLTDPSEELSRLELLEALQGCLGELESGDRTLVTQLPAIMERRWRIAAAALDLQESTLRSRWKQVLGRLKGCIRRKTRKNLAPDWLDSDL